MGSAQRQEYIKQIFGAYATTAANALLDGHWGDREKKLLP